MKFEVLGRSLKVKQCSLVAIWSRNIAIFLNRVRVSLVLGIHKRLVRGSGFLGRSLPKSHCYSSRQGVSLWQIHLCNRARSLSKTDRSKPIGVFFGDFGVLRGFGVF